MITSTRLRRALVATAGAAALVLGATAATASGPDTPNPGTAAPDRAAVSALFPAGSELQFVAVAPCRILDTRVAGGKLVNTSRVFDATLGSYAVQGGKAGSCGIPDSAASVVLNVGAISQNGSTAHVTMWATGTPEPLASIINYSPAGPVANMATIPVNSSGQFTAKTPKSVHLFADVAGFYVKPLYAAVSPSGTVYAGISSGISSVTHTGTGMYAVTFNRDVTGCAATTSSITWASNLDVSPDVGVGGANTVTVGIANDANVMTDAYFVLHLAC
ncbi:MAG TPA: hypothetical protein VFL10_00995 [Ornithinibacter sp.]|nr:hypothetical protein [Ornithinibacter sp.]